MNYKDRCRTCLGTDNEMRKLDTVVNISGADVQLADILRDFYSFQASSDDFYPDNICINCVHHLTLTHSFKLLIESSTKTLEENVALSTLIDNDFDFDTNDCQPLKVYRRPNKTSKRYQWQQRKQLLIQHTPEPKTQIFCVECKSEFHTKSSLKDHCKIHPVKRDTGRDCQFCFEKFTDYKELVMHRKLHQKPFLCLTCWGGFFCESEFKQHACKPQPLRTHDPEVLRQCEQCGKSYPKGYIKYHVATHGNDLKFSCKLCPKKFKVANSLNSHILWNHKRTRDFKCDVCDATFISASSKSTHIRKHHLKEKKYGCEKCTKRFFSKSELQRHMLTHTGIKNFHCHMCPKSYQTRYGLNVHLKSHASLAGIITNGQGYIYVTK